VVSGRNASCEGTRGCVFVVRVEVTDGLEGFGARDPPAKARPLPPNTRGRGGTDAIRLDSGVFNVNMLWGIFLVIKNSVGWKWVAGKIKLCLCLVVGWALSDGYEEDI